jgi:putative photosynthetic complex assembly protein 2
MSILLLSLALAVAAWWLSTGVVIYLDGLPRRTFPWSMAGASLLLGAGIGLAGAVRNDPSVSGAYLSFLGGFLAWGWQEVSFYTGYVTGPRKHPCPPGCRGWQHFGHALQVSLWHEIGIVLSVAALWGASAGGSNRIGLWAFVILWVMHESARINVFLGVRNVSEGFLPAHLAYLSSFLRRRPWNPLIPFALAGALVLTVVLLRATLGAEDPATKAGTGLLAALAFLGLVEHLFLVLPIPLDRLWTWGLRSRRTDPRP